jgi:hypothetical protein
VPPDRFSSDAVDANYTPAMRRSQYIAQVQKGATAEDMPCRGERYTGVSATFLEHRGKPGAEGAAFERLILAAPPSKNEFPFSAAHAGQWIYSIVI